MNYERIQVGRFIERPNRFIARIEINGNIETVHVKNTGRCAELLRSGATVYVQESDNPGRKTRWDLIGVEKNGRMVNVDSQIPNYVVKEWIESGNLFKSPTLIKPEKTYGQSRFDLYVEEGERKAFIEVKGVTLEENGTARFPDAPTERGVKHVEELCGAVKDGYEAYIIFVIQMQGIRYFTPNEAMHKAFGDALRKAKQTGVHILAYDCKVKKDSIIMNKQVPVILEQPLLMEAAEPITVWYRKNRRQLPWREHLSAYRVWVSEIMLQQTRVEAVKPYYERFMQELPTVKALAEAEEDKLLKLWEGLGYYNRVRNMQKAARQIMEDFGGEFPADYDSIRSLAGVGNYTAGAISSFAYGIPKPAVDGNVLRVLSRILGSDEDIMKASVRSRMEEAVEEVIPKDAASEFNQGLIELGALVCVPNGVAKCGECPVRHICIAQKEDRVSELPVKSKAKARKIEKRTVFIFKDGERAAIRKRPGKGLLAGLYELPNETGHMSENEVIAYCRKEGLTPIRLKALGEAKHIFSHIEWHMIGYAVQLDELSENCTESMIFVRPEEVEREYPIPAAFEAYTRYLDIRLGPEK